MDQPPLTSSEPPSTTTTPPPPIAVPASPEQAPQQSPSQPQPQQPPSTTATSTSSSLSQPPSPLNPNPSPKPPNSPISPQSSQPQPQNPILRTPFNRPWAPNPSPFSHFSSIPNHSTAPSSSSITHSPRPGGMAIGVPAPHPTTSFSSLTPPSFSTTNPQVRQSISGMMGSLGSGSSLRPSGVAASLPQRPLQSSLRSPTGANNQSTAPQNFQEHGHPRLPSVGSPGAPAPTTLQSPQSHNQPWLSSGSQGKPPLPPSFRPPMNPQLMQQRPHLPPSQQPAMSASTQQPQTSSSLQSQPSSLAQQPQDHYSLPPSRVPQTLTHQQQMARNRGLGNQRPFTPSMGPPSSVAPPAAVEPTESCNRIISKRSIQEIVAQIDPTERLDPEVEDILIDVADEFVESVTTFACSLAKHRKSNTLESKDILLHLEKNWNMSLPGFGGDEIKCYKKPFGNDVHRERLAAIKRSIAAAAETPNTKSSGGQVGGGAKAHPVKAPGLVIGSPNPKAREAT
ncbi:transcription initiation factor TFIID subunit 12-like [Rutidosis leptorrhynchoides]|uniref:transcription initiation factor TFIID subunit 12-like n=1 Tax=Rutidosis leptorrhynchoides TaxID=125765 RepID=UPI003A98EDE4